MGVVCGVRAAVGLVLDLNRKTEKPTSPLSSGEEYAVFVGNRGRAGKAGDGKGTERHLSKGPIHWSNHSALLSILVEFFLEWARAAWRCTLLQVEPPCLLAVLPVGFLLPFGGKCARQARVPCWLLAIARLGL